MANEYCTDAQLCAALGINADSIGATKRDLARSAASRQVDGFCGRFFYQDSAVADRQYFADNALDCMVDDISTTTGLIVKVDNDSDGTFETTLTVTTNYILLPTNAPDMQPVRPYTQIRVVDAGVSMLPVWNNGRPGVQVTAKFGWPSVPDDIVQATVVQAVQLFKSADAAFGGLSFGDAGFMRVRGTMNPLAAAILEDGNYVKPRVA